MPVQTKTFTVDGETYTITQLGAKKGRKIWLRLARAAAAPIRELGESPKLNEQTILAAIASGVEHLNEDDLEVLYEAFGETCTVQVGGNNPQLKDVIFDQHFAGRYVSMTKWLWECVSFNFASFLGDTSIGSIGSLLKARGVSLSPSPTGSTGSSGGS